MGFASSRHRDFAFFAWWSRLSLIKSAGFGHVLSFPRTGQVEYAFSENRVDSSTRDYGRRKAMIRTGVQFLEREGGWTRGIHPWARGAMGNRIPKLIQTLMHRALLGDHFRNAPTQEG